MSDKLPVVQRTLNNLAVMEEQAAKRRAIFEEQNAANEKKRENRKNHETNIIFAVDATASREAFWAETSSIQSAMFFEVDKIGGKISAQLVKYSGPVDGKIFTASDWYNSPFGLCEEMIAVKCVAGVTQIAQVFSHAMLENCIRPVSAIVLVGDSCEEDKQELIELANQLKRKKIPVFLFDDADRSGFRHDDTLSIFKAIAKASEGEYVPLEANNLNILSDYLRAVARMATGDADGIKRTAETARTPEGREFAKRLTQRLALPKPPGG